MKRIKIDKWIIALLVIAVGFFIMSIASSSDEEDGMVNPPTSSDALKGELYTDVEKDFLDEGFTNVSVEPIDDLITGWLTKDGEVEQVTINGEEEFVASNKYLPSDPVVIHYHTFPEDAGEETEIASEESSTEETMETKETVSETTESLPTVLTVDDEELYALLTAADDYDLYQSFANSHKGDIIEFDARVDYVGPYENYNTRFEMVFSYDSDSYTGPSFKLEDFNRSDIHYTGDGLYEGLKIKVQGTVDHFNRSQGLFYLDDVTVEDR